MTAAKRHGIDLLRHRAMQLRKEEELTREIEDQLLAVQTGVEVDLDDHIGDDLLRLVFIACHPLLSPDARAALTARQSVVVGKSVSVRFDLGGRRHINKKKR